MLRLESFIRGRGRTHVFPALISVTILFSGQSTPSGQQPESPQGCAKAAQKFAEGKRAASAGRTADAIAAFRAAADSCPGDTAAGIELVRAQLAAKRFQEAEESARSVLMRHPQSEPAQLLLAHSLIMQERFQESGQLLRKLLDQDDRNPEAHKLMGLTLFFYKQYVLAEHELTVALRQNPDDQEALYYLGRVYYTQNNFGPAVKVFQRLVTSDAKSFKGYDNLGLCYQALGKTEDAIAAFRRSQEIARKLDLTYDWPHANLAELLIQGNRLDEALPSAREAVRINPRSARNHYLLAKALARGKGIEESVPHLRRAIELDPQYAEAHYLLGQVYQKLGRREESAREFALFEQISKSTPHKKN